MYVAACCLLFVVCSFLVLVVCCCLLFIVCCLVFVVCCLLLVRGLLAVRGRLRIVRGRRRERKYRDEKKEGKTIIDPFFLVMSDFLMTADPSLLFLKSNSKSPPSYVSPSTSDIVADNFLTVPKNSDLVLFDGAL